MVKSLHLLSIVVPSLSMKSDSPQVLLQMGSSHKGGGAASTQHSQHLHNGVQSMAARMESMIQQAIANGGTPDLEDDAYTVMTEAIDQIEELLKVEKTENDKTWKTAVDAVGVCNTKKGLGYTKPDGVNQLISEKDASCNVHKTCRGNEDDLRGTEKEKHDDMVAKQVDMTEKADKALEEKPSCVAHEASAEEEKAYEKSEELETYLGEAREWSQDHKDDVTNSIAAYVAAEGVFATAANTAKLKADTCDDNQHTCEQDFCAYRTALTTVCNDHKECVDRDVPAREATRSMLQEKEKAEKIILQSCSKVTCYINLMKKGEGATITQEKYDGCRIKSDGSPLVGTFDGQNWDPDGDRILSINWVTKIDPEGCDVGPVKDAPGTDAWQTSLRAESAPSKDWLTGKEGIMSSLVCNRHLAGVA